jgi:hypothetical protein
LSTDFACKFSKRLESLRSATDLRYEAGIG